MSVTMPTLERPAVDPTSPFAACSLFTRLVNARQKCDRSDMRKLTGLLRAAGWSVAAIEPRPAQETSRGA